MRNGAIIANFVELFFLEFVLTFTRNEKPHKSAGITRISSLFIFICPLFNFSTFINKTTNINILLNNMF